MPKPVNSAISRPKVRRDAAHTGNRRGNNPTTSDLDYSAEEAEFFLAMETYRRRFNRPFPTLHETLEVLYALGWRKVADPVAISSLPRFGYQRATATPSPPEPTALDMADAVPLVQPPVRPVDPVITSQRRERRKLIK